MNDNDMIRVGLLAGASVLTPLLVVLLVEPATWVLVLVMILAAVGLLGAGAKLMTALRSQQDELRARRAEAFQARQPMPAPQPAPEEARLEDTLTGIPVPSSEPDYQFLVSAKVRWAHTQNGRHPVGDPAALVKRMVLDRICAITATHAPGNPVLLQQELAADLSVRRLDTGGALLGWAEGITLTLSSEDSERLAKLAALRKEVLVWEHERRFEINKREYLGKDVLKSTGSAVVWRLAQDHRKIVETVDLIDTMTRLTAAANDDSVPSPLRKWVLEQPPIDIREEPGHPGLWSVPDPAPAPEPQVPPGLALIEEMFPEAESGQRELFQDQLAELVRKHGRPDIADQLHPREANAEPEDSEPHRPADPDVTSTETPTPDRDPLTG
ncbi:hypothetical protein ACTG9Q_12160 [Actinokineospora sp. 24-640]